MPMPMFNTREHWGLASITLHWVTALLVLGLVFVGFLMQELPNTPFKREVYLLHKSFGLLVLGLTVLRLLLRLLQPTPLLPATLPRLTRLLARLGHAGLYLLLLAIPVTGWLYNRAANFATPFFEWTLLPRAGVVDRELRALAGDLHTSAVYALLALLLAHAGAALWHHYRHRNLVLTRMAPWVGPPPALEPPDPGRT